MKPYPKYKDSELVWLGKIPGHWSTSKFRYLGRFAGGGTPSKDNPAYWNGSIPWVSPKDMKSDVISDSIDKITPEAVDSSATKVIPENSVLMVVRSGILQHTIPVGINSIPVSLNQDMKAIIPKEEILPKYIFYFIKGANTELLDLWSKQGATVESLDHEYITKTEIPFPPLSEQRAIAAYLDRETAKIDTLIAKQQQMIVLLEEKRQSLISHAVTKGIDPSTKLKESGVEWLGKVPEHWEVKRIRNLYSESVKSGNDTLPILSVSIHSGISDKELNDEELDRKVARSEDKSKYKEVYANDLVYNMMRAWQGGFGAATLHGMVSPAYIVARPKKKINSKWVELLLRTPKAVEELRRYSRGITDFRLRLYWDEFKSIYIVLPPESEISEILSSIDASMAKIDALVERASASIKLLNEKRSSIISAVVTGKIDVRDEVDVDSLSA